MKNKSLRGLIEDYIKRTTLMQVATAKNNQPWACSVYFAYDSRLSLYWLSRPTRRHSQELRANKKVAGTIVIPYTSGDKVRGLQFQGVAKELHREKEVAEVMVYYAKRFRMPQKRVQAIINNTDGHLCYQIKPSLFVLFDEVNYPDEPRQEYNL